MPSCRSSTRPFWSSTSRAISRRRLTRGRPAPLQTAAIKAVLVSFDFRRGDCEHIGRLAQVVSKNMDWLGTNGHPKWRSVDLDYPLRGLGAVRLRPEASGQARPGTAGAGEQRQSRDGRHQGGAGQLRCNTLPPGGQAVRSRTVLRMPLREVAKWLVDPGDRGIGTTLLGGGLEERASGHPCLGRSRHHRQSRPHARHGRLERHLAPAQGSPGRGALG